MRNPTAILTPLFIFGCVLLCRSQPEVFQRSDFQLRGPVEACIVLTDYGEERFEFDREGKLLKSLTRYSDTDYDITYYRYRDTLLTERRDEVYRDGTFDKQSSFAHFYQRDTLRAEGDLIEKIISYDQKITEQITYNYDSIGRVSRIIRVKEEGIDETEVAYNTYEGENTTEYYLNGQLVKSVRISEKEESGQKQRTTLSKQYFQGTPQKATEEIVDAENRVLETTLFTYDPETEGFVKEEFRKYSYAENGMQNGETLTYYRLVSGKPKVYREIKRDFLYQTDGQDPGNWIKKIVTPQNTYTTRRISYYNPLPETVQDTVSKN